MKKTQALERFVHPLSVRQLLAPLFKEDPRVGYSTFFFQVKIPDNDNNDNKKYKKFLGFNL